MSELTPRQSEVLAFIREFIEESGMPPTRAEIAARLGVSSAAEAMAVASVAENGTDTVFNFVSGDTLTLAGILPTGISDGSFVFYDSLMP